jgi:mercuric ion transport protein
MATRGWPTAWLLYPGLTLMVVVAIWDLAAPPRNAPARPREGVVS